MYVNKYINKGKQCMCVYIWINNRLSKRKLSFMLFFPFVKVLLRLHFLYNVFFFMYIYIFIFGFQIKKARRIFNENSSDAFGRYSDRLGPRPKMRSVAYRCVAFMRLKITSNLDSIESEIKIFLDVSHNSK